MPTQPAASNSPERKGGLLHKGNTGCVDPQVILLSSLTWWNKALKKVSSLGREREGREVHFAKVYSLGKGCSFSPESLCHLYLLVLNINYLSCHLITEPKHYLFFPSYLHRPFPLSRTLWLLFWKGSRVPSLGSFCAISCWKSILWDYFTQN